MRRITVPAGLMVVASIMSLALPVFAGDAMVDIEAALRAKYPASTLTPDRSNLQEAGSPLTLKVSNLFASNINAFIPGNTYKAGKLHYSKLRLTPNPKENPNYHSRTFVVGERLWVTKVEVDSHEVTFDVCSDDIYGVRYRAKVKFPFGEIEKLTTAQVMEKIDEVFDTTKAK